MAAAASKAAPDRSADAAHADAGGDRIVLEGVTKRFATPTGEMFTAIKDVSLRVAPGEFCAVVGPTGCGKSTTLTLVAGLEHPTAGSVYADGHQVQGVVKGTSFMFQADALLPWKSVEANVAMGPMFRGASKKEALGQARDWLRRVGLSGFESHHPHQLSGGMRKRAAMAAALINEPSILLMDEPFGALDVQTKAIMSNELLRLWEQSRPSVLFITHDLEEAIALADKVIVMTAGPGTVKDVYDIDLPRPRGAVQDVRFQPRFLELQHQIWESLKDEVQRAYAKQGNPIAPAAATTGGAA
ncbi:ABC transporter ATP-binding protein [Acidiferrimicrobium sp. IK]|uniref:ABC transporter ATP-binding protein n=1 Tax=Acidiferrimicrobium sp. IK TaxID=2871700 RepID=UPI0021CAE84B|nr:ABC transporter ATP-binding protein [Acidiferrimicrobium sp. IK]MCU4186695.1 ABC transporter ATP-binding protein [Acidiferrimicrobium sp. IK]